MAFKESGISEKFSDATKKFFSTNTLETKIASIQNHHSEGEIISTHGNGANNVTDIGSYSVNELIDNSNNDVNINQNQQVTNTPIPQMLHTEEPEIVSDYGYSIQSETLQEQTTHVTFSKEKKDTTVVDEILLRGNFHHISHKNESVSETFVDKTSLFKTDESKQNTQDQSPYIYYDLKRKKDETVSDVVTEKSHDKMAYREIYSESAGGTRFEAHYSKHGTLKTEVKLSSGKERTDNKGFKNKSVQFVDKTGKAAELLSPDENEAAASAVDAETEIVLEHVSDRFLEKRNRYRTVEQEVKSERKQIEKEIKTSKKQSENDTSFPFKNTSSAFKNNEEHFESAEKNFKNDRISNPETSIFITRDVSSESTYKGNIESTSRIGRSIIDRSKEISTEKCDDSSYSLGKISEGRKDYLDNVSVKDSNTSNKKIRNVDSYFSDDAKKTETTTFSERFMTKEERLEQAKSKEKAVKKSKDKELRKAAATTAVAKMFNAKKNMQNQLGDMSGQGTGDLLKDGSTGLVQTFVSTLKQGVAYVLKSIGSAIWKCIGSILGSLAVPILIFLVCFLLIVSMISALGSSIAADSDSGVEYDLDVTGDGFVYESLTDEEIEDIIAALYENYDDMTLEQEMVLRYSLSKVGCAYDQAYHGNLTVDIFDCSSLAYRSYLQAGIDISNGGGYSAADECFNMVQRDKITDGDLKPGDLLFYGGSDNGRYLGVYHVAIYVGTINGIDKMVEARGTSWGVVYCDVRTNNVVKIARPYE